MRKRQPTSLPDIANPIRASTFVASNPTTPKKTMQSSLSPTKFKRLSMMESTATGFLKPREHFALTPMQMLTEQPRMTLRTRVPLFKSTDLDDVKRRLTIRKKQPFEPDSRQYSFISREQEPVKQEQHSKLVYEQSHEEFYKYYRDMERLRQKQKEQSSGESPFHTILKYIAIFNLPPKTYEMIKQKGDEKKLELARLGLGRSPALAMISRIIEELDRFKVINLSENDIGPEAAATIISKLNTLVEVDLSFNSIGLFGVKELSKQFKMNCSIRSLNLEKNNLNDKSVMMLVEAMRNHGLIKILNLSQNYIAGETCSSLKELLAETEELEELYLHWCDIDRQYGVRLLSGLTKNKTVKVLDLSWNRIGNSKESLAKLSAIFEGNTNLVHVDLSYCEFTFDESKTLAESLEDNNTLTGLHFEGNSGFVNHRGYLIVEKRKKHQTYPSPIKPRTAVRRIRSVNYQSQTETERELFNSESEVCWICMGWQEVYFRVEKQSEEEEHFLHLSVEGFAGIKMTEKEDWLECFRIVPIGQLDFFFTVGKEVERIFLCDSFPSKKVELTVPQLYKGENTYASVKVDILNSITISRDSEIFNEYYEYLFKLPIRAKDLKIIGRKGLNFATSYFRSWKMETKRILDECLAYDLKNSKILKVLKKEPDLHECSKVLREHYQTIRNVFTLFASREISSETNYGVSSLTAMNFGREFGYISKKLPDALYQIKFITSLTKEGEKLNDPNKLMVRSSFFEFLVRLAEEKYVRGKFLDKDGKEIKYSYADGLRKLIEKLTVYDSVYNFTQWRTNRYWNQDNDKLLKAFRSFTEPLYEKYAGTSLKVRKKGEVSQLSLQQFKQIFNEAKINTNNEIDNDLNVCYDLSRSLTVDQASTLRKISQLEFAEALARFADKRNFFPIGYNEDTFSEHQIGVLPLCMKLEGLLFRLLEANRELSNPKLERLTKRSMFTEQVYEFQFVTNRLANFNSDSLAGFVSFLGQRSKIKINSLEERKIQTGEQISQLKFELEKEDRLKKEAQRRVRKQTSIASSDVQD